MKSRPSLANGAIKTFPISSTIVSFLQPSDIPSFAGINTSTRNLIRKLKNSVKFQNNNSFSQTVLKMLQTEANKILNDPEIVWTEQDEKLTSALMKIKNGKIDKESLQIIKTQHIKYKNTAHQTFSNAAKNTLEGGLKLTGEIARGPKISAQAIFVLLFLVAFLSALISVIGGVCHGITHCTNECRSLRHKKKLEAKLAFFKSLPSDEKENKPDKDPALQP